MNRCMSLMCMALALASTGPAFAFDGTVVKVPAGQHLACRKKPNPQSAIINQHDNGAVLEMLGPCKNVRTGKTFNMTGPGTRAQIYAKMAKSHVWCSVVCDAPHTYGWVRGRFVFPN
jgi:hypothetical protein